MWGLYDEEKQVFLTFAETNQLALVQQAAIRQKYIDQTQSLNLAFAPTDSPKWINQVHMEGWKLGINQDKLGGMIRNVEFWVKDLFEKLVINK